MPVAPIPSKGAKHPLPSDIDACAQHVASDAGTTQAWACEPVTFADTSKTGGGDRGYATRVKTAVASRTGYNVKTIGASLRRDGDAVTVTVWRKVEVTPSA